MSCMDTACKLIREKSQELRRQAESIGMLRSVDATHAALLLRLAADELMDIAEDQE